MNDSLRELVGTCTGILQRVSDRKELGKCLFIMLYFKKC